MTASKRPDPKGATATTVDAALLAALDERVPPLPASKRVALLGGSFNPPHLAHAMLGLAVLSVDDECELWVLPCADHPFGKELAPLPDRLEMCRFAFSRLGPRARVVDLESGLPSPSYTVQTLRALHRMRPGIRPLWVAGADLLDELHRWQEPLEVERLAELFLVPRPGYDDRGRARLDFALAELSSRDLRARLAAGEDVPGSLDAAVRAFILARNLYRTRR